VRSRDGKEAAPTRAYQKWFDELLEVKKSDFIPSMEKNGLLLPNELYEACDASTGGFLAEVPDFNSLIAISQSLSKPVFMLTRDDIKNSGSVAQNQIDSANSFKEIYRGASEKIIKLLP
jgi:hypothetical protein